MEQIEEAPGKRRNKDQSPANESSKSHPVQAPPGGTRIREQSG
jgi:hypothetical protein